MVTVFYILQAGGCSVPEERGGAVLGVGGQLRLHPALHGRPRAIQRPQEPQSKGRSKSLASLWKLCVQNHLPPLVLFIVESLNLTFLLPNSI